MTVARELAIGKGSVGARLARDEVRTVYREPSRLLRGQALLPQIIP